MVEAGILLFVVVLIILFAQDFKERKISLGVLIGGVLLGVGLHFYQQNSSFFWSSLLINMLFISLVFGILTMYAKLKLHQKIFEVFGSGDLLFFVLLAVSFPTFSFVVLFIFSIFFAFLVFILLKKKLHDKTVPLAGLQSLFLGIMLLIHLWIPTFDLYRL